MVRQLMAARFFPEYQEASPPPLFGALSGATGLATLESALNVIRQPYYRRFHDKAGALLRSMIKNHPFIDGNKRIALVTTYNFLALNNQLFILTTNAEMVDRALRIAKSEPDMPWQDVARWIEANCVPDSVTEEDFLAKLADRPPEVVEQIRKQTAHISGLFSDVAKQLGS